MQGLIGMQQPQAQQQANLLGGLFQSPQQARAQSRNRLFENAIALSQSPTAGFAIAGGLLGEGISRAMGRVSPEENRAMQLQGLQSRLAEQGLDPATNPFEFYAGLSQELQGMGMMNEAMAAAQQAKQFRPEPVDLDPATFYNPETQSYVRGAFTPQGVAVDEAGRRLPSGFVESDYEQQTTPETFRPLTAEEKAQYGIDQSKFAQVSSTTNRIYQAGGQEINVGGEPDPAIDALGDVIKNDLDRANKGAATATGILQEVDQLSSILSQPDFNTGTARSYLTGIRGFATDLGVDFDSLLSQAGLENVGDLQDAQTFEAFSATLVTRLAERLPGNLNQQEINLIKTAASDYGRSPEANARVLAAFRASAELSQRRANELNEAAYGGTESFLATQRRHTETGLEEFRRLTEKYQQEILSSRGTAPPSDQNGTETTVPGFEGFQIREVQ